MDGVWPTRVTFSFAEKGGPCDSPHPQLSLTQLEYKHYARLPQALGATTPIFTALLALGLQGRREHGTLHTERLTCLVRLCTFCPASCYHAPLGAPIPSLLYPLPMLHYS